jgi:hypothetical protein
MIYISSDKSVNLTQGLAKSFGDIGYDIGKKEDNKPKYKEMKSEKLVESGPVMTRSEQRKKRIEHDQAV